MLLVAAGGERSGAERVEGSEEFAHSTQASRGKGQERPFFFVKKNLK